MSLGKPYRRVTTIAVVIACTLLAACGVARAPLPASLATLQSFANRQPSVTRRYGWKVDAKTPRVRYVPGTVSAGMPTRVDLRDQLSPIDDQGALNSCTGFAIVGLAEFQAKKSKSRPFIELSPSFIYKLELLAEGNVGEDTGARIRTGMNILLDHGTCPESEHPYLTPAEQANGERVHQWLSTMPTADDMQKAAPYRVHTIKPVDDLADFKAALAKGHPVVFGMMCAKSFESDAVKKTGIVPVPDPAVEPLIGGHAIMAIGYDEAKQQIIFRNSYSPAWGDKGYGYLPYAYFKKELVGDAWEATGTLR
jgi:C1A family cysteine protease